MLEDTELLKMIEKCTRLERLDMNMIMNEEPPKIDFVLPSLSAGSVGILSGAGGTGKSMLALQLMFTVAAGNYCDFSLAEGQWKQPDSTPAKVAYISIEDPSEILHSRLHSMIKYYAQDMLRDEFLKTGMLDLIDVYSLLGQGFSLMTSEGMPTQWHKTIIEACKGARLVFIDTMRRAHDANENDNGLMSIFLKHIEIIAKNTGASIVLLHHENKSGQNDESGSEASRGASSIVDNARWVARVKKMSAKEALENQVYEADRRFYLKLTVEKNNYGAPVAPVWLQRNINFNGVLSAAKLEPLENKGGRKNG